MRSLCCALLLVTLSLLLLPAQASAFCGFYVSGGTSDLYNEATQVVLMRDGTKTILSMRNSYKGPAKDFAMVVPVPVVLHEGEVETLEDALFDKIDTLTAPRLVEYWEHDPCENYRMSGKGAVGALGGVAYGRGSGMGSMGVGSVRIEAQFNVAEYEIVILSATESTALESWLVENKYNIPKGASEVLQSYISQGQYFFVARVNVEKVSFDKAGRAMLHPLRFHYDSDDFQLPVRLGLLNARGAQDLIIHVLSPEGRYEVANYENAFVPTNLIVSNRVEKRFPAFYEALFQDTVATHPRAVITEYAWKTNTCDPCPGSTLDASDLEQFGSALSGTQHDALDWTVTRLHARYTAKELEQDLVFRKAPPVVGGRGMPEGKYGKIAEKSAVLADTNNFQGRYIMLHFWGGELTCPSPERYDWSGSAPESRYTSADTMGTASKTRFYDLKPVSLKKMVRPGELELARKAERSAEK